MKEVKMIINKKDFVTLVNDNKQAILKDIQNLVKIDSSEDLENRTKEHPLGPGVKKAGLYMMELAKKNGFNIKNHNDYVYETSIGPESKEYTATINHLDVVPVDNEK
jgi:acetylornithine deacetylase/succinyl-diaminopimelate desuccinylase-like protein